jgi:hypothetical protein
MKAQVHGQGMEDGGLSRKQKDENHPQPDDDLEAERQFK